MLWSWRLKFHNTVSRAVSVCAPPPATLPPRGRSMQLRHRRWLHLSNLDGPRGSRLLCLCTVSFRRSISPLRCEHPSECSSYPLHPNARLQSLLSLFSRVDLGLRVSSRCGQVPPCLRIFFFLFLEKRINLESSNSVCDQFNVINLQLSSLPLSPLVVSLSLSSILGLHPLQNSHCPGQRGDRLLLLEGDCLQRHQHREWISTTNPSVNNHLHLRVSLLYTPTNRLFGVRVFFSRMAAGNWKRGRSRGACKILCNPIYNWLLHLGDVQPN